MGVRSAALQHVCDLVQRGSPDALRAAEVAAREHGAFALNAAGGITATEAATCRRLVDELVEHVEGAAGRAGSRAHAWALLAVLAAELDTQSILARQEAWMAAATKVIRTEQNAASLAAASNCAGVLVARLEPLLGLPGVKRSASAAASKLISSTAQRIENVDSARAGTADRNGANGAAEADTPSPLPLPLLLLLESATRTMPASARPHIKAIEAVVFRRLDASTQPSDAELLAAARTAALVPAATGTPQAWSLSAAASVFALHVVCDRMFGKPVASSDPAFHAHAAAEAALAPLEGAAAGGTAAARLWMTRDAAAQLDPAACVHVATAAICAIEAHLALPFPVPVPLPAGPLANAACRLLAADAAQDPAVALRLPQLHAAALELLGLLVRRGGAAVAPQHCTIAAAVNVQLAIAAAGEDSLPPAARLAAYRAVAALADAGGGRVACDLVPALLSAAIQDVFATSGKSDTAPRPTGRTKSKSAKKTPGGGLPDAAAMAAADPYLAGLCGADRTHRRGACQAAALHALAATLRAGGPLLAPDTRALADAVAARAARAAARALESHRLAPMPGAPEHCQHTAQRWRRCRRRRWRWAARGRRRCRWRGSWRRVRGGRGRPRPPSRRLRRWMGWRLKHGCMGGRRCRRGRSRCRRWRTRTRRVLATPPRRCPRSRLCRGPLRRRRAHLRWA
ncbi:unnamed protein product [Pedinophyceae sp. YPF-701]|nr:unnamed protein product [Pedinophyceae sp. YPF-701]